MEKTAPEEVLTMTIHICGDSTAAAYPPERAPLTGWGQLLGEHLPGVTIVNHAAPGCSSRSFLAENRLAPATATLRPGDLLLIQFTHNDRGSHPDKRTHPRTTFLDMLNVYVDAALRSGATPVLLTPIPVRLWEHGNLIDTHSEYPDAIRYLARTRDVPLLEITFPGMRVLRQMGEEASRQLYMNLPAGVWPAYPDGLADDIHTQTAGAALFAEMIARELQEQGLV